MEQSPSSEGHIFSLPKYVKAFYGTQRFVTVFTTACYLPFSEPGQSNPLPQTVY